MDAGLPFAPSKSIGIHQRIWHWHAVPSTGLDYLFVLILIPCAPHGFNIWTLSNSRSVEEALLDAHQQSWAVRCAECRRANHASKASCCSMAMLPGRSYGTLVPRFSFLDPCKQDQLFSQKMEMAPTSYRKYGRSSNLSFLGCESLQRPCYFGMDSGPSAKNICFLPAQYMLKLFWAFFFTDPVNPQAQKVVGFWVRVERLIY